MTSAARIRRLTLTNFRSYHAASLTIEGGPVVLIGPNGAGKTNLLEAISFFAPGRGLRRAMLEEVALSETEGELGLVTLGTGIESAASDHGNLARLCRIDREAVTSAAAFADHVRITWLV